MAAEKGIIKNAGVPTTGSKPLVILEKTPRDVSGDFIAKILSSRYYVFEDQSIENVADALAESPHIRALAVVSQELHVKGIIVKAALFELLGQRYCRDVFSKKPITAVMHEVRIFNDDTNIFYLSEVLTEELKLVKSTYFAGTGPDGTYSGIFSTRNLLIYLSDITKKDIKHAVKLQKSLFKEENSFSSGIFEFFALNKMALGVGGDLHFQYKYNESNWIIMLGDVSGKGVSSAFITAAISGILYSYDFSKGLHNLAVIMNRFLYKCFQMEKFVTAVLIDFNETTGGMIICDMGHSMIFLARSAEFSRLATQAKNLPLGIDPEFIPEVSFFTIHKDDLLFILSDGIIEQMNSSRKEYSAERFGKMVKRNLTKPAAEIGKCVIEDVTAYRGNQPQHDDIFSYSDLLLENAAKHLQRGSYIPGQLEIISN